MSKRKKNHVYHKLSVNNNKPHQERQKEQAQPSIESTIERSIQLEMCLDSSIKHSVSDKHLMKFKNHLNRKKQEKKR